MVDDARGGCVDSRKVTGTVARETSAIDLAESTLLARRRLTELRCPTDRLFGRRSSEVASDNSSE